MLHFQFYVILEIFPSFFLLFTIINIYPRPFIANIYIPLFNALFNIINV